MLSIRRPWAFWRRVQYGTAFVTFLIIVGYGIYGLYWFQPPNCFDNKQNADEAGVDCGGGCARICAFSVKEPEVLWSRSFKVTDGMYNAVGYIENPNPEAATSEISYTFSLYDQSGLITERSGMTALPPNNQYPVFAGRIETGDRVPSQTQLTLDISNAKWYPSSVGREQFRVISRELTSIGDRPRLYATLANTSLEEYKDVEIVATIFDSNKNALTTSRTVVDIFESQSEKEVIFTWPQPIASTLRSCEVATDAILAIDLSGSMNNDGGSPPEPISSVVTAAESFVERLRESDQASLITFASEGELAQPLTDDLDELKGLVRNLTIDPGEERGSTNTGAAFSLALSESVSGRQNPDARKIMVILTDGLATAPEENPEQVAINNARALKDSGVVVYAIGLGQEVNMEFVSALASTPQQAYQALGAGDIDNIYREVTQAICEDGPAVIEIIPKAFAN